MACWMLILVIYAGSYGILRWRFSGYVRVPWARTAVPTVTLTESRIEMPVFRPRWPRPFRVALDAVLLPASRVDELLTGRSLRFEPAPFPTSPLSPLSWE